jgi:tetratricopeptide (TPR) repeat protein
MKKIVSRVSCDTYHTTYICLHPLTHPYCQATLLTFIKGNWCACIEAISNMNNSKIHHFDLSGETPDVEDVMRLFRNMPGDQREQIFQATMERMSEVEQGAEAASTRQGMIDHFLKARVQIQELRASGGQHQFITTTNSTNVKPQKKKSVSITDCTPITISQMTVNNTHRLNYLCGKVAVDDSFRQIQHIYFLLEDIQGNLVRVSVYNTNRIFKLNEGFAIIEPFYKIASGDGIPVVRIDRPAEIIDWKMPSTTQEWTILGNSYLLGEHADSALHCYEASLKSQDVVSVKKELSVLLNNIAQCEFRRKRYEEAVWFSGTAVYLDRDNIKPWYRLIEALLKLDIKACRAVLKDAPTVPILQTLRSKVGEGPSYPEGMRSWTRVKIGWMTALHLKKQEIDQSETRSEARGAFQNGDFELASQLFTKELCSMSDIVRQLAEVCCSMSAAYLHESNHHEAILSATVSILLYKFNTKSWIHRSNAEAARSDAGMAKTFLDQLVNEASNSKDWGEKRSFLRKIDKEAQKMATKHESSPFVREVCGRTTAKQLEERKTRTFKDDTCNQELDSYIMTNERMIPMIRQAIYSQPPTTHIQRLIKSLASRKCPKIHDEFSKQVGWPAGSTSTGRKLLYSSYLDASCNPWRTAFLMSIGKYPLDEMAMLKRWNGPLRAAECSKKRASLTYGSIVDIEVGTISMYDPTIRSIFLNVPNNPLTTLSQGKVHVSFGFNDLSELLSSKIIRSNTGPLRFIGVEKSAFCVARSLVILEMLRDEKSPIKCIIQVWYSSGWAKETLKHFRNACQIALTTREKNDEVSTYLHYWLSTEPLSALDARAQWIKTVQDNSSSMMTDSASFHRLRDRLSILHYLVSGEIIPAHEREGGTATSSLGRDTKKKARSSAKKVMPKVSRASADYGSMVFWSVPPNCAPLESDIFFNAISMETLLENFNETQSIVDNLIDLRLRQLSELRRMLIKGIVSAELLCDSIEPGNGHLIQRIAALKPETASWSNLVDYSDHGFKGFHQIARQLNAKRHFGQSMNWVCMVYGACVTDYIARSDTRMVNEILAEALESESHVLLTKPFFDAPHNLAGYVLAKKFKQYWLAYFSSDGVQVVADTILAEYPLYRNTRALFLEWTYEQ